MFSIKEYYDDGCGAGGKRRNGFRPLRLSDVVGLNVVCGLFESGAK